MFLILASQTQIFLLIGNSDLENFTFILNENLAK